MCDCKALKNKDSDFVVEFFKNSIALNQDFHKLRTEDVDILLGGFNYSCRFKHYPQARYLSVQLHSVASRGEGSVLPVFSRWDWGETLGAHVLSICDPTLYLDETLTLGWYLGNRQENVIPGVVAIAQRCAELLSLPEENIIFSGSAGGGFAALQAAAMAKDGRAIAINAQTNLSKYNVNSYIEKVSGCASLQEAESVFAERWNAITSLQEAVAQGRLPKIVYVQNRNDWHYQAHFTPFAEAFGLNLWKDHSASGNFMSILYDGPNAHTPEPPEVVKRINCEGVPFLLNGAGGR